MTEAARAVATLFGLFPWFALAIFTALAPGQAFIVAFHAWIAFRRLED